MHSRSPENVRRLLTVLRKLDAKYYGDRRQLRPNESHIESPGHQLLETSLGRLDALGTIEEHTTYEDLLPHAIEMDVGGFVVRVLSLERQIEVKRALRRPKDLQKLPEMLETLRRSRERSRP